MTNIGVSRVSLSHVIFSFGVAPEYEPYGRGVGDLTKYAHGCTGSTRSYLIDGDTIEVAGDPPPIWKKPTPGPNSGSHC